MKDITLNQNLLYKTGYKIKEGSDPDWVCYDLYDLKTNKKTDTLDLTKCEDNIVEISAETFAYITNLKKVILPETLLTIDEEAFRGCTSLKEINFPDSLLHIGFQAFWGCKLGKFIAPKNLKDLDGNAFKDCKLTKVVLNEGIKNIYSCCFAKNEIEQILIPKSCEYICGDIVTDQDVLETKVYLPKHLYKEYKSDFESYGCGRSKITVFENNLDSIVKNANSFREINNTYKIFKGDKDEDIR